MSGKCLRCGFADPSALLLPFQSAEAGDGFKANRSETEGEQQQASLEGDFGDLASILAEMEASRSDDSGPPDTDAHEEDVSRIGSPTSPKRGKSK